MEEAAEALTGSFSTPKILSANPLLLRSIAIEPPMRPIPIIPTIIVLSVFYNCADAISCFALESTSGFAQSDILM